MLFLFQCFLFGRFSLVKRRFKFHFTSSRCTGILRLYGKSLSRLTGISVASTGIPVHRDVRSPYKRNRENNSKLSTSRDPGTPGRPGTPGSYKQALSQVYKNPKKNRPLSGWTFQARLP